LKQRKNVDSIIFWTTNIEHLDSILNIMNS
jgi:hypothetical protein